MGPLTVVFVPPENGSTDPPRVAFAVGRKVGPAVVRNRIRRRARAVLRALDQPDPLAPGSYLVIARPAAVELSFAQLGEALEGAVRRATRSST